jgi:hypothetical protein
LNYYCRELRGFGRWMVSSNRATSNPLAGLKGVSDADADKQETREFSAAELVWLLAHVEKHGRPWSRAGQTFTTADRVLL